MQRKSTLINIITYSNGGRYFHFIMSRKYSTHQVSYIFIIKCVCVCAILVGGKDEGGVCSDTSILLELSHYMILYLASLWMDGVKVLANILVSKFCNMHYTRAPDRGSTYSNLNVCVCVSKVTIWLHTTWWKMKEPRKFNEVTV